MLLLHCRRYLQIFIGCFIAGAAMNLFLIPAQLLASGLAGTALIVYYLIKLPVGIQLLLYNLPIIYLAYRVFGKLYAFDTIIGTLLYSVSIDALSFLNTYNVVDNRILGAVFGGTMAGIGFGIIFRAGANSGGLDVIGAVIKKYYSLNVGTAIFAVNIIVIFTGMFIFNIEMGLLTLIATYCSAEMINKVVAGFNRKKSIMIISPHAEQIAPLIMQYLSRGVTFFRGEGAFTRQPKHIIFVVVSLRQVSKIKSTVHALDPNAFMLIADASEVSGRGFTIKSVMPQDVLEYHNNFDDKDF